MNPETLAHALLAVLAPIAEERRPGEPFDHSAADIVLERPRNRDHGDWASNIAMRLAKPFGTNPRELAQQIADGLVDVDGIASVEVAGPGFLNIRLDAAAAGALAKVIVDAGPAYGTNSSQEGVSVNVEFVSANPTGPLHIAHTRWAALGDAIVRLLLASGARAVREYYINDAGVQMDRFAASVLAAAKGEPTPEGGYPGQYIATLAGRVLDARPDLLDLPEEEQLTVARELGYEYQLAEIKNSLERFNVPFDVWFSERTLHAKDASGSSLIDQAVDRLREQGHVFDEDGAVWVRTTDFGDDKDRVIRRSNGEYTYFAADAAYYLNKGDRGFRDKIYLLGADHHGYVHRLKAVAGAAGTTREEHPGADRPDGLDQRRPPQQACRQHHRDGRPARLARHGRAALLAGALARRLAARPRPGAAAEAHERQPGVLRPVRTRPYPQRRAQCRRLRRRPLRLRPGDAHARDRGGAAGRAPGVPRIVAFAAEVREPHRVARYLEELAGLYHRWYDNCRVIPLSEAPVEDVHRTRLWLNDAAGQVFRNGLDLLGVSAPERM